jgi:hypothetical protein
MLRFELLQFPKEQIEFGITYGGAIEDIVEEAMMVYFASEFFHASNYAASLNR